MERKRTGYMVFAEKNPPQAILIVRKDGFEEIEDDAILPVYYFDLTGPSDRLGPEITKKVFLENYFYTTTLTHIEKK
jgi:hypothetical protein